MTRPFICAFLLTCGLAMTAGCLRERVYRALEPRALPALKPPEGLSSSSAVACGSCHQEIYDEWKGSMMAQAFTDPVFQADWNHQRQFPWCLNCHAPRQDQQEVVMEGISSLSPLTAVTRPNPDFDAQLQSEGVTCVVCHQQQGAIRAPHADAEAPHATVHDPTLAEAETCVSCHQMEVLPLTWVDRPLADTHQEWAEWKEITGRDESCIDCHMPAVTRPVVAGGTPRKGRRHFFAGAWDEEMVKSAVRVEAPVRVGNGIELVMENQAGHRFPSGEPARVVRIVLSIQDEQGEELLSVVERIDRHIAGPPGVREKYDKTLAPAETRKMRLMLAADETPPVGATAIVRVVFDRVGNLDSVKSEVKDVDTQVLIAEFTLPW